jgi:inositol phosphorylceramide synthase catalytic subunit
MESITGSKSVVIKKANKAEKQTTSLFTKKSLLFSAIASVFYLVLSFLLIGFKSDQLILVVLFNLCYFGSRVTRQFIIGFSIFIIYWIIFDYMKAFPNYLYNEVHIETLYDAEKALFGLPWNGNVITPNEYFARQSSAVLDVLTGFFYLCWIPVPLTFAGFLFFKNRQAFFQFSLTFFLVNIIGFIGYYIYPAAPPWYVAQYGFNFDPATPGNTAGLSRFDAFFDITIFHGMYAKSSNVFAAMPSMHAAFLMIVLFFGLKYKMKGWNFLFATIMVGIWFAAVYTGHHYILDVLAGITCAIAGITLIQWWVRTRSGRKFMAFLLYHTT